MSDREIWFGHFPPAFFLLPVHWKGLLVSFVCYGGATIAAAAAFWAIDKGYLPAWPIFPFAPYAIATIAYFVIAYRHSPIRTWSSAVPSAEEKQEQ